MRNLGTKLLLTLLLAAGTVFGCDRLFERPSDDIDRFTLIGDARYRLGAESAIRDQSVRWGGDGIILTVGKESASLQFGCARAVIPKGLKPVHGKFNVTGTYTPSTAIADAETPKSLAIRAEGRITGKRMTLKITSLVSGEVIGSYKLERGKAVVLQRCL